MRKITNREKVTIGFGGIVAIGVIIYFVILPIIRSGQSRASLDVKQERLQSVRKLKGMEPLITELERDIKTQLGYDKISFSPRTTESSIMTYMAQMANQSEIREVEQLDVKPDRSKKKDINQRGDQTILKSIVSKLYVVQVKSEKDNSTVSEEAKSPPDKSKKEEVKEEVRSDKADSDEEDKQKKDISKEDIAQEAEKENDIPQENPSDGKMLFPVIPKDIPDKVSQNLVTFIQTHDGKTLASEEIDKILETSEIKDEKEVESIKNKLVLYSNRVREKKGEVQGMISKLGLIQKTKADDKIGKFTIKMVFKSDINQLVKLLYNLQTTTKWVKIDGMTISVADRQKALLGIELTMSSFALYD